MEPSTSGAVRPSIPPHSGNVGPIIFSAPMVRALLDGRKTQTRRIMKPPYGTFEFANGEFRPLCTRYFPGDRLYVRENWWHVAAGDGPQVSAPGESAGRDGAFYRADWPDHPPCPHYRGRPSIHMPRWASRLTLIVECVKVERLQNISEADARAEGCDNDCDPFWRPSYAAPDSGGYPSCKNSFEWLWQSLNGPDAWALNPWCAAISFRVIKANIDSVEARNV